jgi:Uma2 family endonuclease
MPAALVTHLLAAAPVILRSIVGAPTRLGAAEEGGMATSVRLMTADELLNRPDDGQRHELIAGQLRTMPPPGIEHGEIVAAVVASLAPYVRTHRLGRVQAGEPGYVLATDPDTVRGADVAFISQDRRRGAGRVTGYWLGAPDLVVEVISPSDLYTEVDEKVAMWLAHGARMVVAANPRRRTVAVHRSPAAVRILSETETLDGEDVVPGWSMPVAAMFEDEDGA